VPEPTVRRVAVTSAIRHVVPTAVSGYFRILDLERGRVSFVTPSPESTFRTRDPNPRGGTRGARGVSVHGDRLVVANAERLFVFDTSWRLVSELSDRLMADVHDVLAEEHGIWVAATGCDLLLFVRWDGRIGREVQLRGDRDLLEALGFRERSLRRIDPEIDWRDPRARGEGYERLHVNSLALGENGSLLASLGRIAWTIEPEPQFSSALVEVSSKGQITILYLRPSTVVPNHNVAEDGDLFVYNDSNRDCLVAYDRARGEEVRSVPIPGGEPWARGLARIGPGRWLVGSQAPLAVYEIDLDRGEVVEEYPLGGVKDETVYGVCPIPDRFGDPRQPLGDDPYEFWKRAAARTAVTPIGG
jgi:hypothetical protein